MDRRIEARLSAIAARYRQLAFWNTMTVGWLLVFAWTFLIYFASRDLGNTLAAAGLAILFLLIACFRRASLAGSLEHAALEVERHFPDLQARLLTAMEQKRHWPDGYGFLQQKLLEETLTHANIHSWDDIVPKRQLRVAGITNGLLAAIFLSALSFLSFASPIAVDRQDDLQLAAAGEVYKVTVEPGNVERERGTDLVVLARFQDKLPEEVTLIAGEQTIPMSKSMLADPVFAARVVNLQADLRYHVVFGSQQSAEYTVKVFEYPALEQMDARIEYPQYTSLEPAVIEDTLRVSAVEGSHLTLSLFLNKPVAQARLVADDREPIEFASTDQPKMMQARHQLLQSGRYQLELVDAEGRKNRDEVEISLEALPNLPPELQVQFPSRDLRVSPLEEIALQASVWDDFGVNRYGLSYSLPGAEPVSLELGQGAAAKEKKQLDHLLALESLSVKPDQLVSYYFWAEDIGPDGSLRRVLSDMFFAEVRHFEEIFRQGQQPPGGGGGGQMAGGAAQQAGNLAEIQKQIVNATWKMIREFTEPRENLAVLRQSQESAIEQLEQLKEQTRHPRAGEIIKGIEENMREAVRELSAAADTLEQEHLEPALIAEQKAYQGLLSLRAREHQVVRGQQQAGGGGGGGGASQQQLQQLELDNEQNRYETRNQANAAQQNQQQREDNQVLNRLRELAQRQKDLNQRLKELVAALQEAKTQEEQEKLQRELKRLRDEEREILRDVDQLRERMQQPENQSRMAEANQQLEQTRSSVREASKALEEGMVPQALAEGTRAQRSLQDLQEDFRKRTSNQFADAMKQMQQQAAELDATQKNLAEQLRDDSKKNTLRDDGQRQQLAEELKEQKKRLESLLEHMKEVVEEAESSEPLLSKQLYDSYRRTHQQKIDQALEQASELTRLGFTREAQQPEEYASSAIDQLHRDVDKAASSILGDETEALRRAKQEVEELRRQLQQELARATGQPDPQAETGQDRNGNQDSPPGQNSQSGNRRDGQTSQPGEGRDGQPSQQEGTERQPGGSPSGARPEDGERESSERSGGRPDGKREPSERSGAQNGRGGQQPQESQDQRQAGGSREPSDRNSDSQREGQQADRSEQQTNQQSDEQSNQQGQSGQAGSSGQRGQASPENNNGRGQGGQQPSDSPEGQGSETGDGQQSRSFTRSNQGPRFFEGGMSEGPGGPIAGQGYREWSDRLRDVEEMLQDPQMRSRVAQIRDRARSMRVDIKRHSKEPNWSLVEKMIAQPLTELSQQIEFELAKREETNPLAPIDRDPVPRQFSELVRRYYQRLSSGK